MIGPGHSTYCTVHPSYTSYSMDSRRLTHQTCRPCGETPPSPKGGHRWSGVEYQICNQKRRRKKKKRNPLHLHLAGRCDLFWKPPSPIQRRKSPEPYAYAKYASRQQMSETGENEFSHSARLFFYLSSRCKDSFLEGGLSVFPEDGPTTGKFNYWQIHTVGPTSLLVCIIIIIIYCIVAVQVQDGVCSMMIEIIIISGTRRNPTCELFMG